MSTKTVRKNSIFLISISALLLCFGSAANSATIGNTKWFKKGNAVYPSLAGISPNIQNITGGTGPNKEMYSYNISFEEPAVESMCGIDTVSIAGSETWDGNPGAPKVPYKPVNILIPYGASVSKVTVNLGKKTTLPGVYSIEHAELPYNLNQMDDAVPIGPDAMIYGSNLVFPEIPCGDASIQKKQGFTILTINLLPVEYLPKPGKLSYYDSMTVKIETAYSALAVLNGADFNPDLSALDEIRSMVNNPEICDTYSAAAQTSASLAADAQYLIITTNALKDGFQPLIAARQAKGMTVKLVTTDNIAGEYSDLRPDGNHDIQTAIRNCIKDGYTNHGTKYVLLGGDGDKRSVPPRIFKVSAPGASAGMPADLYYACLDGTFDGNRDGAYGSPKDGQNGGDVDLFAEVYVGRCCASNLNEVSNFVNKTLSYERSQSSHLQTAYMVGEYLGFGGVSQYATNCMEQIRLGGTYDGYTTKGFENSPYKDFFITPTLYDSPSFTWNGSALVNNINTGLNILNHLGHANYTYDMRLYTPGSPFSGYPNSACLTSLNNTDYFFAYSQGCNPGGFDRPEGDRCLAEIITTMPGGAFAVVMNARYGWGMGNSTDGPSQRYHRQFWHALFGAGKNTLGAMNHYSKEANASRINGECMRWCYYETNLFGDPALSLHTTSDMPNAPTNLTAAAISSSQIKLTWADNSTNETGFKISRALTSGGPYACVNTAAANATTFTDSGLSPLTTYYYVVCSTSNAGDSSYSNEASAKTLTGPSSYTITATAGSGGTINPSGSVTVVSGASKTFSISANSGYHITDVMVDNNSVGKQSSYSFTNVTANHTITAYFSSGTPATYTITASAGTGGVINPSGSIKVTGGSSKTFTVSANTNYNINDVKVDGASVGKASAYTFTNVTANHTIAASFVSSPSTFTITASAGTGGNISPNGSVNVSSGGSKTFSISAGSGCNISDVKIDNSSIGAVSSYTFTNVRANHTISASFTSVPLNYTITSSSGTGGSINPSGSVSVTSGGSKTFSISAGSNYNISDVKVDGVSVGKVTTYTFSNVTANHTIAASFATGTPSTYLINALAIEGGTITPSGNTYVNAGGSKTFTVIPNSGYAVVDLLDNLFHAGPVTSYTVSNINCDHWITVSFRQTGGPTTYTIYATQSNGGTISPGGNTKVNKNANITYGIGANQGYAIADVKVDGISVGPVSSYTFTNVTSNHTIEASFTQVITYIIAAQAQTGGTISPSGNISVAKNSSPTFTITANSGYAISNVAVDGTYVGTVTSYKFSNVTKSHTITAYFRVK